MPATHEPCPSCDGMGHICEDEKDPRTGQRPIQAHNPPAPLCEVCGGHGLLPIGGPPPEEPPGEEPEAAEDPAPAGSLDSSPEE